VVLTHPHADHLNGLVQVLDRYEIGEIWESGADYPNPSYDTWKKEIQEKNIPDKLVVAGDSENFSDINFKVLYPLTSFENKKIDNLNNASVVTELKDGRIVFLFLGDLEKSAQSAILNTLPLVTVLKVAHHGSENGTSEDLLKVTRPAVAVIEVGEKNIYGHPHQATLNLLKKYLAQIYRTDQNGTVTISTDGQNYQVKTEK
jgi:competence protein ComEC